MRILGISAFYHDSAAALVDDGRIVAAAQEEIVAQEFFQPDRSFQEEPLPAVRAPDEARSCLERLARLHTAAA